MRQEAALLLALENLDDSQKPLIIEEPIRIMKDRSLPPEVRGEAIKATFHMREIPKSGSSE